jgi:hypothetical protein
MSRFKVGDRVYFKALYGSHWEFSGFGTIDGFALTRIGYHVKPDSHMHGLDDDVVLVEPETKPNEVLELESVYNSPLWKALL